MKGHKKEELEQLPHQELIKIIEQVEKEANEYRTIIMTLIRAYAEKDDKWFKDKALEIGYKWRETKEHEQLGEYIYALLLDDVDTFVPQ